MEVSREVAYELIKKELTNLTLDSIDIYISKQPLPANSNIETVVGTINSPETVSWLFFVDEMPKQNWGHPCQYIFVDANMQISIIKESMFIKTPSMEEMEMINMSIISKEYNPQYAPLQLTYKKARTTSMDNFYAVIISGGGNKANNHIRYWNDCAYIYQTLIHQYNYDPSKVFVLISDGIDPNADTSSGTSSPIDLDDDGATDIDYAATKTNIKNVFNQLATQLTKEDYLFIYTIDHGGIDKSRDESYLILWNNESLYASDFYSMIKPVEAKAIHIVMGQCYSGGFIDYFNGNPNICISTACRKYEVSYAMSNLRYDEYVYYWTNSHYLKFEADTNGDNHINALESHQYASKLDSREETPQHHRGGLLSQRLTLSGIVPQLYANYVDGYCMINGYKYSFYADEPNHEPEFGVVSGNQIDITITEPIIKNNGNFSWSVLEGHSYLVGFTGNNERAHLEIRPQSTMGQRIRIKVETNIPIDNYYISQYLNFYITSYYRIEKISDSILSIEKDNSANTSYNLLEGKPITTFDYQIIENSTGITRINGSYPINQILNLNISHLSAGTYTIIITENGKVQAQQNINL